MPTTLYARTGGGVFDAGRQGSACTGNSDCPSGNCVDGICCDPSCTGTCQSCALAKTAQPNGTCAPVGVGLQTSNNCNTGSLTCNGSTGAGSCTTLGPTLPADVAASADTVMVADINAFADSGTIEIDQEVMTYNGKRAIPSLGGTSAAGTTQPGELLNVHRGMHGTVPSVHHAGAPITLISACAGDCGGNASVTVDEILTLVNGALGNAPLFDCEAGDNNHDGQVTVDEILTAVNNALNGCPVS